MYSTIGLLNFIGWEIWDEVSGFYISLVSYKGKSLSTPWLETNKKTLCIACNEININDWRTKTWVKRTNQMFIKIIQVKGDEGLKLGYENQRHIFKYRCVRL